MACLETRWLAAHVSIRVTRAVEALVVLRYTGNDASIVVRTSCIPFMAAEAVVDDLNCTHKPNFWVSAIFACIEGPKMDTDHDRGKKERKRKLGVWGGRPPPKATATKSGYCG